MAKLENKTKENPKLEQNKLSDGRISLYLEYYLGREEKPVLDENGNLQLWMRLIELGSCASRNIDLRDKIVPSLSSLLDSVDCLAVHYGIMEGDRGFYVIKLESPRAGMLIKSREGLPVSLVHAGLGKCLLAYQSTVFTVFKLFICTLRPTNLPLKVFCFGNLSLAKFSLHFRPVLEEIIQDRRIEPHGHRAVRRPVIIVIIAQRKIRIGVVLSLGPLCPDQVDDTGHFLIQPKQLLHHIGSSSVSSF